MKLGHNADEGVVKLLVGRFFAAQSRVDAGEAALHRVVAVLMDMAEEARRDPGVRARLARAIDWVEVRNFYARLRGEVEEVIKRLEELREAGVG